MILTPGDVADFTGRDPAALNQAQVQAHLDTVTAMVRGYTRGRGFDPTSGEPADDLALVIVASVARLLANPEHTVQDDLGAFSKRYGIFNGWTLPELAVLHRYRRRTG